MKNAVPGIILISLVLLSVVPFADRSVYLDEHIYLHVAKFAVEKSWLFPQETQWIFFGTIYPNLAAHTHPPVGEYFLALMFKLLGRFDEVWFRLLWAIFPVVAILSFYRLARHFTFQPLLVASLFAVSPAFFVLSPTLMMDLPMLAFFLAGLAFYLECLQGKATRLWPAAISFVVACGIGYSALVPLACLFLWAAVNRRPKRELFALAAAPAVLFIWLTVMRFHFGEYPVVKVARYFAAQSSLKYNLLPTLSFLGGIGFFPWLLLFLVDVRKKLAVAVSSILAAIILSTMHSWTSFESQLWFIALGSSGIMLLILFVLKSAGRAVPDRPLAQGFLFLWVPATLLFFFFAADMVCARYILLSLPPIFLVTLRSVRRTGAAVIFSATIVLSLALAIADYRLVNSYRDFVAQTVVPLQQQGFRIWSAAESGLRFYLEQRGIVTLSSSDLRPKGGDLIVKQSSFSYALSKDLEPILVKIKRADLMDIMPVLTFSAGAGFHDSHLGLVPFSFSRAPLDHLELSEVSPFVKRLPEVVPSDFSGVPVWFPGGVLLKQVQPEMMFPLELPRDIKPVYELEGDGTVEMSADRITLRKKDPGPIAWKNFRIIPRAWPATVDPAPR